MHRRTYRHLKTQALALARQVPLFKAQDPMDNLEFLDWFKPKPFDAHTHTITLEEFSLGFSDYQDKSFKDYGITDYKIASLNCRGLASHSSRERLVHIMKKYHLDILCLQETKINVNPMELHLRVEMKPKNCYIFLFFFMFSFLMFFFCDIFRVFGFFPIELL